MTALDRALIKAYRAEHRPLMSAAQAPLPAAFAGSHAATLHYHAGEPTGARPHLAQPVVESRSEHVAMRPHGAIAPQLSVFHVDMSMEAPAPAKTLPTPEEIHQTEMHRAAMMLAEMQRAEAMRADAQIHDLKFQISHLESQLSHMRMPLSTAPAQTHAHSMPQALAPMQSAIPVAKPAVHQSPPLSISYPTPSASANIFAPATPVIDAGPMTLPIAKAEAVPVEQFHLPIAEPIIEPIAHSPSRAPQGPTLSVVVAESDEDTVRAQLVVDRFQWPAVCERLEGDARRMIADFCQQLSAAATQGRSVTAIVGMQSNAGCTTTVLSVARHLGVSGLKTALIDANVHQPRLADELGIDAHHGWEGVSAGQVLLGDVLVESLEEHLVLLPCVDRELAAHDCARGLQNGALWPAMRNSHDVVLLDCGTIDSPAALDALSTLVANVPIDAIYLVCDARSADAAEIDRFARQAQRAGVRIEGVIETFCQ